MTRFTKGIAAGIAAVLMSGAAMAAECDTALGEKQYKKCKACHKLEAGKNGIGPHLVGVVGRSVAAVDGFKYSAAMTEYAAGDAVWDAARLDTFLTKPKDEVKGTKMAFGGIKKEEQRAALICYLESIN